MQKLPQFGNKKSPIPTANFSSPPLNEMIKKIASNLTHICHFLEIEVDG